MHDLQNYYDEPDHYIANPYFIAGTIHGAQSPTKSDSWV